MGNIKTRILSFILVLAMVFSMVAFDVFAADVVADSGEAEAPDNQLESAIDTEEELKAALEAGGDVVLGSDVTVKNQITIPKGVEVYLNLNGYDINGDWVQGSETNHVYVLSNYGRLVVSDLVGGGAINSRGVYNYGELVLDSGAINSIDGNGGYAVNNQAGSTFVMNGGVVAATYEDDHMNSSGGYDATALKVPAGATATLNGGKIVDVCDYTYAIEVGGKLTVPADSKLVVEGTHGAVYVSGGEAEISGGKFTVPSDEYARTDNVVYVSSGKLTVNGGTFIGDSDTASGGTCLWVSGGEAVVNGGNFSGSSGGDVWGKATTVINGGSFENLIETSHVAVGATIVNGGKTYTKTEGGMVEVPTRVAVVDGVYFESVLAALKHAVANASTEVKLLADSREVMPDDIYLLLKADLVITADAPVKAAFYNNGTTFDFVIDKGDSYSKELTIDENVTFELEDRVIWVGFYSDAITLNVEGTVIGGQYWMGGDTVVTGKLVSSREALVIRRGKTLFVDGGLVEANYFSILAGGIFAENDSKIVCGPIWVSNTGAYAGEGNVNINIWESTLECTGGFQLKSDNNYDGYPGVYFDVYDSNVTVKASEYGDSIVGENAYFTVNGANSTYVGNGIVNNGTVDICDGGNAILNGNITGSGALEVQDGSSFGANNYVPKTYAASVNGNKYETLGEALQNLTDGATLKLLQGFTPVANQFIELNGKKNVTVTAASGVVIDGSISIGYHASHVDGADRADSTLKVVGLTVNGTLTVCSNDKAFVVEGNKAAQITVKTYRDNMAVSIVGNYVDGTIGAATQSYGVFFTPNGTNYDLVVDGNKFENVGGHAFVVQGCGDGAAVTAANSIVVENNKFVSWGLGGKANRAAFKIWADTKYAPAEKNNVNDTTPAMRELALAIKEGGNEFLSEAANTVEVDVYGIAADLEEIPAPAAPVPEGFVGVSTYEELVKALEQNNAKVYFLTDITGTAALATGYGKVGILVKTGDIVDGNGKKLTINGANGTWDSAISMTGGEVKNLTVSGAMRGIFMPGADGDVVIDNCKFEDVIYTFNSDDGSAAHSVTIKNTVLNGWTSFSAVHGEIKFVSCTFGKGSGYATLRPYQGATFVECDFAKDYTFDATQVKANEIALNDCTVAGEAITEENAPELFKNGGTVLIDDVSVNCTKVCEVNGVKYTDLLEAIKAAAPSGTVELLTNVTVDKWNMISEIYGINPYIGVINLDLDGLTIDGNGFTLTVKDIESAGNGNYMFYDGDYNLKDLTIVMANNVNGFGITSGTISNVTFLGGYGAAIHVVDGTMTGVHAEKVVIEGCTFKNNADAIYYQTAQNNLVVNNNTFEVPANYNVILLRGTEQFTNNTIVSGRTVNVVSGSPVVSGNNFGDVRLKVYNEATATIKNNTINVLTFNDDTFPKSTFENNTMSESAEAALEAFKTFVAEVNGVKYATLAEALAIAKTMTGEVEIKILGKALYDASCPTIDGSYAKLTFVGASEDAEISITRNGSDGFISGKGDSVVVEFVELVLSKPEGGFAYDAGFRNVGFNVTFVTSVTYTDCVFVNGACASDVTTVYNNCTFNKGHDDYAIYAYASENIVFNECIFDAAEGIKMYDEGANKNTQIIVNKCDFSKLTDKPAIVLTYGSKITLSENTYSSTGAIRLEDNGSSNGTTVITDAAIKVVSKTLGECGVLVGDKIYRTVEDAAAVAVKGDTVTLLANTAAEVELNSGVVLNKNGFTADGVTVKVDAVASVDGVGYATLAEAFEAATDGSVITLLADVALDATIKVNANVTLDLNGKTITGTDNKTASFALIEVQPGKVFTVEGEGKITLVATNNRGWNAYSSVISVQRSTLVVNGGTIQHLGGTDMAYAIDVLTNTGAGHAEAVINGGALKSTYRAVRLFANSTKATTTLTVNGGTVEGDNRAIWVQNANASNNPAKLNVDANAVVNGDVLLSGNNATAWKLEIAVDASAIKSGDVVVSKLPENIKVENANGVYGVVEQIFVARVDGVKFTDLQEAIKAAAPSGTVELLSNVTVDKWIMISETLTTSDGNIITLDLEGLTIDGNGFTLTVNDAESDGNGNHLIYDGDYNVKDLTIVMANNVNGLGITSGTISNVTFIGGIAVPRGSAICISDGIITGVHAEKVVIEGCTFKNNGAAVYYETAQNELVVNNNTFAVPANANVILFRGTEQFTNNTVVSGRTVNVVSGSPVISGNNFGDVRLKVYNEATATIKNNTINVLAFNDDTFTMSTFKNNTMSDSAEAALEAVKIPDNYIKAYDSTGKVTYVENIWLKSVKPSFYKPTDINNFDTVGFRLSYNFDTSLTVDEFWANASWKWTYWIDGNEANAKVLEGKTITSFNRTSILLNGIDVAHFSTDIHFMLEFNVEIDGTVYTIQDQVRTMSVKKLAEAYVAQSAVGSDEYIFAKNILAKIGK